MRRGVFATSGCFLRLPPCINEQLCAAGRVSWLWVSVWGIHTEQRASHTDFSSLITGARCSALVIQDQTRTRNVHTPTSEFTEKKTAQSALSPRVTVAPLVLHSSWLERFVTLFKERPQSQKDYLNPSRIIGQNKDTEPWLCSCFRSLQHPTLFHRVQKPWRRQT